MSISSSYTGACALAAKARVKFQGQDGNKKDQNLRLIIAHAQLYDRLDDDIESLGKIRRLNVSGESPPPAPLVAVPNHKEPLRMTQQVDHQRDRTSNPRTPPWNPHNLAAECADEGDEDPKSPSKTSDTTCSVSIQELDELENPDHEDLTSRPHASPSLMTSTDSDSDSSNSDYDGDLDSDLSFNPQAMEAIPAPTSNLNPSQPRIRWQDHESGKGLQIPDIVPQDPPKIEPVPPLQRCCAPGVDRAKKETQAESERTPGARAVAAPPAKPHP